MKQRLDEVGSEILSPIGSIQLSSEEIKKHFVSVKHSHPEIEEIFAFTFSYDQDPDSYAYAYSDKFVKLAQAEAFLKPASIVHSPTGKYGSA